LPTCELSRETSDATSLAEVAALRRRYGKLVLARAARDAFTIAHERHNPMTAVIRLPRHVPDEMCAAKLHAPHLSQRLEFQQSGIIIIEATPDSTCEILRALQTVPSRGTGSIAGG
jgi:hypothetical protein